MRAHSEIFLILATCLTLAACGGKSRGLEEPHRTPDPSSLEYGESEFSGVYSDHTPAGKLTPTFYYVPVIELAKEQCSPSDRAVMIGKDERPLVTLCLVSYNKCLMQGSCKVKDRSGNFRSFQYHSKIGTSYRFMEKDLKVCPTSYGSSGRCLKPFYAIAADLTFHPIGTVIFVPKIKGLKLPDGKYHSGYFVVLDKGGNIKGKGRFDFFTGPYGWDSKNNVFIDAGLGTKSDKAPYDIVTGETAKAARVAHGNNAETLAFWRNFDLQ